MEKINPNIPPKLLKATVLQMGYSLVETHGHGNFITPQTDKNLVVSWITCHSVMLFFIITVKWSGWNEEFYNMLLQQVPHL